MMKVIEHEHPLQLVDLKVNYPIEEDVEEDDNEEEKDLVTQDEFVCLCKRCGQEINEYYRYYYECMDDSCEYPLHKFCAELPKTLKHTLHPHPLTLFKSYFDRSCDFCHRQHNKDAASYFCVNSYCSIFIDVNCVLEVDKKKIEHPSHPHNLVSLTSKSILCECSACGKEHKGVFFQCITCSNFSIHNDCAFLPKKLLIQHTTNDFFHHTHPLILSYSFTEEEQRAKYYPKCRVCNRNFFSINNNWIYKCEKCIYYAHVDCATSRREAFMSILSTGEGPTIKNFKDDDYPEILHLPFPDQTYSIPKKLFFKEIGTTTYGINEVSLQQINHQHELILVDTKCIDTLGGSSSSKINSNIMCHNPMKKVELLCNGCIRPIMEMPFYKCGANEDEHCNFALHEWCTRLPTKVNNHPGHPQHTLLLMQNVPGAFFNIFYCKVCHLPCNGYAYGCIRCKYYVDVTCAFVPEHITHKSHPHHLLSIVEVFLFERTCLMCDGPCFWRPLSSFYRSNRLCFNCSSCDVYIHLECALLLPETIRHTYDKHPMHLSYLPIENHKSEYFCEICEDGLNPHSCFYHCDKCVQSMHSACAPLILCSETETYSWYGDSIYRFLNVKFGSTYKTHGHPHLLTFAQGIESDGVCSICSVKLKCRMIFKCLECGFAIHYDCSEGLNNP